MAEATPFIVMGIDQARPCGQAKFEWVNVAQEQPASKPAGTFAAYVRAVQEHAARSLTLTYDDMTAEIEKAERQRLLAWWRSLKGTKS